MRRAAAALALLAFATLAGAAPPDRIENPRPFGHVVGDVVQQRIALSSAGVAFEPAELPEREKIGVWLQRRTAHVVRDGAGARWLEVDYQIINASRDLDVIALPALTLRGRDGATLEVPAWPLSVSAMTPQTVSGQGGLQTLQPDRSPPAADVAALTVRLRWSVFAGVISIFAWLAWWRWREWRAAQQRPFARAVRALATLAPESSEAWVALHRAFDASAGEVIQPATLPRLFARVPALLPLRAEIEAFYAASAARFFADAPTASPALRVLGRRLRAIERRQER